MGLLYTHELRTTHPELYLVLLPGIMNPRNPSKWAGVSTRLDTNYVGRLGTWLAWVRFIGSSSRNQTGSGSDFRNWFDNQSRKLEVIKEPDSEPGFLVLLLCVENPKP
jgi:hypothetical protein